MLPSKSRLALGIVGLLILLIIAACSSTSTQTSHNTFPIDKAFSDFYREFGGEEVLGPAISASFIQDEITYQYVVSGRMEYDPGQDVLQRFRFSPVASSELHINGLIESSAGDENTYYVNGHYIWEETRSFYDRYGSSILGLPVTGVMVNDAKQRYEQYFEGVGFYRNYNDPPGKIHLMPYGSWICGNDCQYYISDSVVPAASYVREFSAIEQLFYQTAERVGFEFTGVPLLSPRLGSDGNYQMVFQNVVMYVDPLAGSQIRLRPLPSWMGIRSGQLVKPIDKDGLSFFPIKDESGFNVPELFTEYISLHGSSIYAGNPITEYVDLADGGYSQCFTSVCLEYHPTAPERLRVRPNGLGIEYLAASKKGVTPEPNLSQAMQVNAWENYPLIASGQKQVINIEVTQNNAPKVGIEISLLVKQPDGVTLTYTLPPTGSDGKTRIELDPIDGPNGAMIQYQVCIVGTVTPQVCFSRSYTIWNQ